MPNPFILAGTAHPGKPAVFTTVPLLPDVYIISALLDICARVFDDQMHTHYNRRHAEITDGQGVAPVIADPAIKLGW